MSASIFKIIKACEHCGNLFEAQKTTTRFCTHKCNSANYKLRARLAKKKEAEQPVVNVQNFRPKTTALNIEQIRHKEFLSVREVATLFHCTPKTVYSLIKSNRLKAVNIGIKKTLIKRTEIDKLFA
ncbi:MAG: helix-turn-helix domain-containing protein [Niabella sp.]